MKKNIYIIYKVNKVDKVDKKDNNIILINRNIINILNNIFNNSYLYKIKSFHHFSIHNNNKLNQINNLNVGCLNHNTNYIKIRNEKLFLRILENKAIITINATQKQNYKFLSPYFGNYQIYKVKLNGNDATFSNNLINLEVGINIIEVMFEYLEYSSSMFYNCGNIISIDLSNFQFSQLAFANFMFDNCVDLQFLDLSNLNTSGLKGFNDIFNNCTKLKYINLYNYKGINIFPSSFNTGELTICVEDENNIIAQNLNNAKKNCIMTNLQLIINNFCMKIKNIKHRLYIYDKIFGLNKTNECTWALDNYYLEDNFTFKNILYKKNRILRNSKSKYLNITYIKETNTYEGCTFTKNNYSSYPHGILNCDFHNLAEY
jgi:surface protein